ncbi:Arm DNA-binding domain-containing protein [Bartonella vinsonii]|nr:Arm DNA-binding domain-containing protein [Bartonella vinsonii]
MSPPNIVRFSHCKPTYVESNKIIYLYVISRVVVWVKKREERRKNACNVSSQYQGLSQQGFCNIGGGKKHDGAGLYLDKRKDGGGSWILRSTIHGRHCEMGLGALRDISLQATYDTAFSF